MKTKYTRKQLLKLPERKEKDIYRQYNKLLIVPAGMKHDSGYMRIAVIGQWVENEKEKQEICCFPDDINWILPDSNQGLRTDCFYPQGILRFWGRGKFLVEEGVSSINIKFLLNSKAKI